MIRAGVDRLGDFGYLNTVDRLAGGDATKWNAVMSISWSQAVIKLQLENERDQLKARLHKIKTEDAAMKK